MKVLENNNFIEVVCGFCHSKLGVYVEDIRYNDIAHNCPPFEATCGACGRATEVKEALIPRAWMPAIVQEDIHG